MIMKINGNTKTIVFGNLFEKVAPRRQSIIIKSSSNKIEL